MTDEPERQRQHERSKLMTQQHYISKLWTPYWSLCCTEPVVIPVAVVAVEKVYVSVQASEAYVGVTCAVVLLGERLQSVTTVLMY